MTAPAQHLADRGALGRISVPLLSGGLVIGRDQRRAPVVVRLFRPEPTVVAVVGRWWLARLLVFRALGVGARVVVRTAWPEQWQGLGEEATNRADRLAMIPVDSVAAVPARMDEPALHVVDLGNDVGPQRPQLGPWQAQLTLLPGLVPAGVPVLAQAQLIVAQRLTPAESSLAVTVPGLPAEAGDHLTLMPDDVLALFGGGPGRYVSTALTEIERQLFGAARPG
jgi:hypothetical protein